MKKCVIMIAEVDISESEESVSSVMNSKIKETEEALGDARAKRPRLEKQSDWQWEKVDDSKCSSKIQFSENSGPIKSVRSESEAFKLYFDDLIMDTTVRCATEFIQTYKDELKPRPCVLNWKDVDSDEHCVLFAIQMLMGTHHTPTIKYYFIKV
jgi:hypothetical protein